MTGSTVTLHDIQAARQRIAGRVRHTPMVADDALSDRFAHPALLKCEYLQQTGAFKLRGATNALLSLPAERLAQGVVTASTGNHGRALAYAARGLGVRCVVCLSRLVPANKLAAIRDLGAEVRIIGESQDQAMIEAARAIAEDGMTGIGPFDDPAVVAGQGTLGLEIVEDCPDLAAVLVPLSGGGLAAGIAVAIKAIAPATRVIGLSMENGAAMAASLRAGHPVALGVGLPTHAGTPSRLSSSSRAAPNSDGGAEVASTVIHPCSLAPRTSSRAPGRTRRDSAASA